MLGPDSTCGDDPRAYFVQVSHETVKGNAILVAKDATKDSVIRAADLLELRSWSG